MRLKPAFFLLATGAIVLVLGFAYDVSFAGLPYQDPTPDMQERWVFHKGVADRVMMVGVAVFGIGCLWTVASWMMRLLGRQSSK